MTDKETVVKFEVAVTFDPQLWNCGELNGSLPLIKQAVREHAVTTLRNNYLFKEAHAVIAAVAKRSGP